MKCLRESQLATFFALLTLMLSAAAGFAAPPTGAAESIGAKEARDKAEAARLEAIRLIHEKDKERAEIVADVRILSVVCTDVHKVEDKLTAVTLQIAMQVLSVEKGSVKKNQIITLSRVVDTPQIITIRHYNTGTHHIDVLEGRDVYRNVDSPQCPVVPGVKGSVALRWDNEARAHVAVSGWVTGPSDVGLPVVVGNSLSAK